MSNPQQNLKIPGERIQYATEENAGVVQIAKDINSLTNPEHVPTVKTIQEQFGSEFIYQQGVVLIDEEGTDFDYYKKPGIYRVIDSGIAKSMMNKPKDSLGAGLLIVQRTTGSNLFEETSTYSLHQTYIEYMGDTFNRRYNDNPGAKNFTDWAYDVDSRNISSRMIMHQNYILIDGSNGIEDLNHYRTAGIYMVNRTQVAIDGKNFPVQAAGAIVQYRTTGNHLVSTYYPFNDEGSFTRLWNADRGWSDWVLNLNAKNINSTMVMEENDNKLDVSKTHDLNLISESGIYTILENKVARDGLNFPVAKAGSLHVIRTSGSSHTKDWASRVQIYYPYNENGFYYRYLNGDVFTSTGEKGTWDKWFKIVPESVDIVGPNSDLNNYKEPGRYVQPSIAGASSGLNYPVKTAGALVVLKTTYSDSCRQMYYPFNSTFIFTRIYNGDQEKWYTWEVIKSTGTIHPRDVMLNTESLGTSDLNKNLEPGLFFQTVPSLGTLSRNYPEDDAQGSLVVLKTGDVSRKQIYYLHSKDSHYERNYTGTWSKWVKYSPEWIELYTENLNNVTGPGRYTCSHTTNATLAKNYPVAVAGTLEVFRSSTASNYPSVAHSCIQRYTTYNFDLSFAIFMRKYNGEVNRWSDWEKFVPVSRQLGHNQKWSSFHVNNTRKANTDYTNDTNSPIQVNISCVVTKALPQITIDVDNVTASSFAVSSTLSPEGTNVRGNVTAIVPPGSKYRLRTEGTFTTSALITWSELR